MNETINTQPKKKWWKSPLGPALLSALVAPGTGQIVNGDYKKGAGFFLGFFGSFLWFSKIVTEQLSLSLTGTPEQWIQNPDLMKDAVMALVNKNGDMFITFYLLILLLWVASVYDAYAVSKRLRLTPSLSPVDENSDPAR